MWKVKRYWLSTGAGYNHMNDIVVLQTCQGLIRYLDEVLGASVAREKGIVVGYDHRMKGSLSSAGFARITAAVFVSQGYKVYFLEDLVATPFVAYGVTFLGCAAGIMVTASHNPKLDDGYKVSFIVMCRLTASRYLPSTDIGLLGQWVTNYSAS